MSQRQICVGDGFTLNLRMLSVPVIALRGSSMPASAKYTGPNYNYGYPNGITTRSKTATVTAFIGEKWYQSTYTVSICNAGC